MEFTIVDGNSSLGEVIRWYSTQFIDLTDSKDIFGYKITTNPTYLRSSSFEDGIKIEKSLSFGNAKLLYKNKIIEITVIKCGEPFAVEHSYERSRYHTELKLRIDSSQVQNRTEGSELLEDFVLNSIKEFGKHVLNKPKIKNKLSTYIYNENHEWELLNKKTLRPPNTIYLNNNKFDSILESTKKFLSSEMEDFYTKLGIPYKYNILLHGYPGTGKTSSIYALAGSLGLNTCIVNFDSELTDKSLIRCIQRAPKDTILICEDIDVLFQERKKNDDFKNSLTFSGLLNCLDGAAYREKQIIIMTTNYECNLDSALKRPGRIDLSVKYEYSDASVVAEMFKNFRPEDKNFEKFYDCISSYNITPACLQKYFIENMYEDNIIKNISDLKAVLKENKKNEAHDLLYN